MNREQELEYIKSYAGPGIDNPVEFFDSIEKYAALAEKVSDTSPTNEMSEMEKQALFKFLGKGLKTVSMGILEDAHNYTIGHWSSLLKRLGKAIHGKNVEDMGFYKWLDRNTRRRDILSKWYQKANNDLWGYGKLTNEALSKKVKGGEFEFLKPGDEIEAAWKKGTGPEAWLKKGDNDHVQLFNADGKAWTGTGTKFVKGENGGLRPLTAEENGWTQVARVKNKLHGQHPGWHLGRQLTYWSPGFVAPALLQEGLGDLAESKLGETGRTAVDKAFYYSSPITAVTQMPGDAAWTAANLSKPLLKDYFRKQYYNQPKDILSWLYKLFNPEGYKWKVASEVDKQVDEYLKRKTGGEMLVDAWNHVTK